VARPTAHRWSQKVTDQSNALDLKQGIFKLKNPKRIAASLKESAEHSDRRKADPYRSAMSMLTFYINRAGAQLQPDEKARLERAKDELRQLFDRPSTGRTTALGRRVEKPGDGNRSGPSGQKDRSRHERTHANK